MATTPVTGLPYIANQQNQPEVTLNEIVNRLSMMLYGVLDQTNTPPGSPAEGDTYLCGTSPTGDWSGRANCIAGYFGTSWVFVPGEDSAGTPITMGAAQEGMQIYVKDTNALMRWNGTAWA